MSRPLRVLHCPVNYAGVPWENVQALRRKGVEARLLTFGRHPFWTHCADLELERPDGFWRRQLVQLRALLRLLPRFDFFHFYFGQTLVPRSVQFALLRGFRRRSVLHFLGSDIRGRGPDELAYARRADARIVGSYDAVRWLPGAAVVPPGLDLRGLELVPPSGRSRPLVLHAPSSRSNKGTEHVVDACARLPVDLEIVEGVRNDRARRRYARADIVVDQLNAGWYGTFAVEAMALGKPVAAFLREDSRRRTEEAFGVRVPIVSVTKDTLAERLRPLVESPELRRRLGEQSRAYVERVHDADVVADRLIGIYARLLGATPSAARWRT